MTVVLVAAALLAICAWISRWDLRRPAAHAARARLPYARPRPSVPGVVVLAAAAIAVCMLSLALLPYLDRFRFP